MFREPRPQASYSDKANQPSRALNRQDRFPDLPLALTLRKTHDIIKLKGRELIGPGILVALIYTFFALGFLILQSLLTNSAEKNFAAYLWQTEALLLLRACVLEYMLVSLFTLSIYRLMLLGEPIRLDELSATSLNRYARFLSKTAHCMAIPALAFLPYVIFVGLQILWAANGAIPAYVPSSLVLSDGPSHVIRGLCALTFCLYFIRLIFVQPATAVDATYTPRDSWRVTEWVWQAMVILAVLTVGIAIALIFALQLLWNPGNVLGIMLATFLSCTIWLTGMASFTVAMSISFCLRTGWQPGAEKLALKSLKSH